MGRRPTERCCTYDGTSARFRGGSVRGATTDVLSCFAVHYLGKHSNRLNEDNAMAESVYKVIELVGTSTESWEKAASSAVTRAAKTLRDLRVAEVKEFDLVITDGKVEAYRARLSVSFKYDDK